MSNDRYAIVMPLPRAGDIVMIRKCWYDAFTTSIMRGCTRGPHRVVSVELGYLGVEPGVQIEGDSYHRILSCFEPVTEGPW